MDPCTDELTDGCTHNRHNAMTIAHWPLVSGAKNYEKRKKCWLQAYCPSPTMFSKYTAFSDNKQSITQMKGFVPERAEYVCKKGSSTRPQNLDF